MEYTHTEELNDFEAVVRAITLKGVALHGNDLDPEEVKEKVKVACFKKGISRDTWDRLLAGLMCRHVAKASIEDLCSEFGLDVFIEDVISES